jgi:hypothetical protein
VADVAVLEKAKITGWVGDNTNVLLHLSSDSLASAEKTLALSNLADGTFQSEIIPDSSGTYQVWLESVATTGEKVISPKVSFQVTGKRQMVWPSLGSLDDSNSARNLALLLGVTSAFIFFIYSLVIIFAHLAKAHANRGINVDNIKIFSLMEKSIADYLAILNKAKAKRSLTKEEKALLKGLTKEAKTIDEFFDQQRQAAEKK